MTRAWWGATLVVLSCLAIQSAAAVSATMFDRLGVVQVAGMRQLLSALVLVSVVRPRLRGRSRRGWVLILTYGLAMDAMTVSVYVAIDRLSLGIAATLIYLGPLGIAVASIRHRWEILAPIAALVGVVLVARPHGTFDLWGLVAGLASALALALYTLTSHRAGTLDTGLDSLSLAVCVAAILLLPIAAPAAPDIDGSVMVRLVFCGLAVTTSFVCDFTALRLSGARVVATLFALDPVVGAVTGVVLLDESVTPILALGILLIVTAGATVTALSARPIAPGEGSG